METRSYYIVWEQKGYNRKHGTALDITVKKTSNSQEIVDEITKVLIDKKHWHNLNNISYSIVGIYKL